MRTYPLIRLFSKCICAVICMGLITVYAEESEPSTQNSPEQVFSSPVYNLVQGNGQDQPVQPPSGTLVLPDSYSQGKDDSAAKKCMTVCARWGEECTYVNRGTAGTTRNCRRTCQQFTEECF